MLDRVFLTLEHGSPSFPSDRELSLGESVVRLSPRSNGYLTCDFNVPKIFQGHNGTLLSFEQDVQTIEQVIQAVALLDPIYDQPLERWRVKSLEVAENRIVESSNQFMQALAFQSVTEKNGGHRNHGYHPSVYFGPKNRTSRFYGKEAEQGNIESVELENVIRHEIVIRGLTVTRQIENRAIPPFYEWLASEEPEELLQESWRKYALPVTIFDPSPVIKKIQSSFSPTRAEKLVSFYLLRSAHGVQETRKFLSLQRGAYYRCKRDIDSVLANLSA